MPPPHSEESLEALAAILLSVALNRDKLGPDDSDMLDDALSAAMAQMKPLLATLHLEVAKIALGHPFAPLLEQKMKERFQASTDPNDMFLELDERSLGVVTGFYRALRLVRVHPLTLVVGSVVPLIGTFADEIDTPEELVDLAKAVGRVRRRADG